MKIIDIVDEDLINYKKPNMFIITSKCSFKCDKEYGTTICQNSSLANSKILDINDDLIVKRYVNNPITKAIVFGGLEPFDQFNELLNLIAKFRKVTHDDIIIYTGYKEDEIEKQISILKKYINIIIKFGRFIPNQQPHYDEILGINLMSNNQYAKCI